MRIIQSDEYIIKNTKCHDDGDKLRIIFNWPNGIGQVYIFAAKYAAPVAELMEQGGGKLFTLQEYKKLGGYITEKAQGETHYYIYPLMREGGENILYDQTGENSVSFIDMTFITCQICEKTGWGFDNGYKNHEITLEANYPVEKNIICYVKKKNEPPRDNNDGTLYYFGEPIEPNQPITRIVRTMKNEYLRIFVRDEVYYGIIQT